MLCKVMGISPIGMLKKAPIAVNDVNRDISTISLIDNFIVSTLLNIFRIILREIDVVNKNSVDKNMK